MKPRLKKKKKSNGLPRKHLRCKQAPDATLHLTFQLTKGLGLSGKDHYL